MRLQPWDIQFPLHGQKNLFKGVFPNPLLDSFAAMVIGRGHEDNCWIGYMLDERDGPRARDTILQAERDGWLVHKEGAYWLSEKAKRLLYEKFPDGIRPERMQGIIRPLENMLTSIGFSVQAETEIERTDAVGYWEKGPMVLDYTVSVHKDGETSDVEISAALTREDQQLWHYEKRTQEQADAGTLVHRMTQDMRPELEKRL